VELSFRMAADWLRDSAGHSDSKGDVRMWLPAGTVAVSVLPRRLLDMENWNRFLAEHRDDPGALDRERIALGTFELELGVGPRVIDLTLPASAGY
jgi:hypothetical protein